MSLFGSNSTYDEKCNCRCNCNCSSPRTVVQTRVEKEYVKLPNPDPSNFKIDYYVESESHFVVCIIYPDCTNYEGKKIMVYKGKITDLIKQKNIDPHFSENKKYMSPIARFEPTETGLQHAIKFLQVISSKE